MILSSIETGTSVLRLELDGTWSLLEFVELLSELQKGYELIDALRIYSTPPVTVEGEVSLGEPLQPPPELPEWIFYKRFQGPFEDYVRSSRPRSKPLMISAIKISSPGWIALVGSLNPLKIIADFVRDYRAENTRRREIEVNSQLKREEMRGKLATAILKMMPDELRADIPHEINNIMRLVVDPSFTSLERIADQPRLKNMQLLGIDGDIGPKN